MLRRQRPFLNQNRELQHIWLISGNIATVEIKSNDVRVSSMLFFPANHFQDMKMKRRNTNDLKTETTRKHVIKGPHDGDTWPNKA
jgi:hypothetical protein